MGARWRDSGDEWEAFLGKDEDLFAFESVADLAAFVRTDSDNDLTDHPGWARLKTANAHTLEPTEKRRADLIAVEELLAEKPTEESIAQLANTLAVVSSIGTVCELPRSPASSTATRAWAWWPAAWSSSPAGPGRSGGTASPRSWPAAGTT